MGNQLRRSRATTDLDVDVDVVPHQLDQKKDNWETDYGAAPAPAQAPSNIWETDQRDAQAQSQLPQELITEILVRSSVKSLLSFRCVSQSFCNIIDSNDFIHLHHNRSLEKRKDRKMILRGNPMERQRLDRLHVFDLDTGLEQKMEKPYKNSAKPYGYCKGIVLLFVDSVRLAVWNPSTQQYRKLPRCPIKVPQGCHCNKTAMGLGYDSTSGEYKVVLIEEVKRDNNVHDSQIWIFGLRSNSWRRSSQAFPHRRDKVAYSGYFVNGSLYWLCRPNRGQYALVAFDMEKETISEVSEPLYTYKSRLPYIDIHVLDDRLCMSFFSWNPLEVVFYVREKDGKWNKLFSITPEMPLLFDINRFREVKVLGYWNEGDNKIMLDLGFKFIVLYDLTEKTFATTEKRKLVGDVNKRFCYYPFLCHQSLVSVRAADLSRRPLSGRKRKNRSQEP